MVRRFAVVAFLMACALCQFLSPASAADDILKIVPDSASGFLAINQPGGLDAKLQALAGEMKVPLPPPLMMLKMQTGIKEGLDETGTIAVVVLPPESEGALPIPIVLVPVTDFAKFIAPFEPKPGDDKTVVAVSIFNVPCWARSIGGYAALTDSTHQEVLTKTLKVSAEVPAALAPWRPWLADRDVAVVVLPLGIKRLVIKAEEALERVKTPMAQLGDKAKAAAAMFDVYDKIIQAAAKEVSAHGIGLQIDKQNTLHITSRTSLVAGGKCAELLAKVEPAKEPPLCGFPDRPYAVTGGGVVSKTMWDSLLKLSAEFMKTVPKAAGLSDEQIKKLPEFSFQSMRTVQSVSTMLGVGKSGESIYANIISVMRVEDAKTFMAACEKDMKQYNEFVKAANLPMVQPIETEASDVSGLHSLQFTITAPKFPEGQQPPSDPRFLKYVFGAEGKVVGWIVPVDDRTVVKGYLNKDLLQQTIETIKQGKPGLASNAEIAKTAALLPPDGLTVVYVSPQGAIEFVKQIMTALVPMAGNQNELPEFPLTPPLGFAVTTAPNEVQTSLVVPFEVLRAITPYVTQVQAARSGATMSAVPATPVAPAKRPAPVKKF
jgi:hypothetical protein